MRRVGPVRHARELPSDDQVCWFYGDRAEFCSRAKEFLTEGQASAKPDLTGRELPGIEGVRIERPG